MKKISLILLAVLLVIAFACKKTKKEEAAEEPQAPAPATGSISMNKTSYKPYEVAEITCNSISLNDTSYNVTLNGSTFPAKRFNSKLYVMLPNITSGNYVLDINIASTSYTASLNLLTADVIADPQVYLQAEVTDLQNTNQNAQNLLNSLSSATVVSSNPVYQQEINSANSYISSLTQTLNALSSSEKMQLALMISANKHWFDSLEVAVNNLNYSIPPYFKGNPPPYNVEIQPATTFSSFRRYTAAAILCVAAIAAAPVAAVAVPAVVVGGFCAAMAANYVVNEIPAKISQGIDDAKAAVVDWWNTDNWLKKGTIQQVPNNVEKELSIQGNYRSLYNADASSSNSLISQYNADRNTMYDNHFKAKGYVPSMAVSPPKKLSQIPSPKTYNLDIHSDYLTISNISNSKVSLLYMNKVNGSVFVKFKTNETTNQMFNFNLNYSSPTGQKTQSMSAELVVGTFPPCFFQATCNGAPCTYSWSTGHTADTISVNPTATTIYTCYIQNSSSQSSIQTFTCYR